MKNNDGEKPTWEKVKVMVKDSVGNNKLVDDCRVFEMADGSIMILVTLDESPLRINKNILYKTKHGSVFSENGVSIGFVFRRVRTTSLFHKESNCWAWEEDDQYRECGTKSTMGERNRRHQEF